jgi:hypothetical protein
MTISVNDDIALHVHRIRDGILKKGGSQVTQDEKEMISAGADLLTIILQDFHAIAEGLGRK